MTNCEACNQPLPDPVVEHSVSEAPREDPSAQLNAAYDVQLGRRGELADRVMDALLNRK